MLKSVTVSRPMVCVVSWSRRHLHHPCLPAVNHPRMPRTSGWIGCWSPELLVALALKLLMFWKRSMMRWYVWVGDRLFLSTICRYIYCCPLQENMTIFLQELHTKHSLIWSEFYPDKGYDWQHGWVPNDLRHTVFGFVVHGFQHKICLVNSYLSGPGCVCELCGKTYVRYHALGLICDQRHLSLNH